jgi:hypothetical protein
MISEWLEWLAGYWDSVRQQETLRTVYGLGKVAVGVLWFGRVLSREVVSYSAVSVGMEIMHVIILSFAEDGQSQLATPHSRISLQRSCTSSISSSFAEVWDIRTQLSLHKSLR